jgi:hypothetical protein
MWKQSPTTRLLGALSGMLLAVGCTAVPPERPVHAIAAVKGTAADIQCTKQHVTGSLITTEVCTTKEQRDAMSRSAQDAQDALNRRASGACPGPGCNN